MIEMRVSAVTTHPRTGRSVAVLEPRDAARHPPLALGITRAEACSLAHELRSQATLRGQAYGLLAHCLGVHATRVRSVRLVPAPTGRAAARLGLEWPDGEAETTIEVGQGLGLAVALELPLLVSEALLREPDDGSRRPLTAPIDTSGDMDGGTVGTGAVPAAIPAAFRRAFE